MPVPRYHRDAGSVAGAQDDAVPLVDSGDTDACQVFIDLGLPHLQISRDGSPVDHDRVATLGIVIDTQQQLHAWRVMAVGAVGMGAELLRRVGRVCHILVRLEFEQSAENRLPYIADRFSHFANRIQMSRRIGQHRETMCQQPLKKKHHTAVCRKIAKGKAHRVRIERAASQGCGAGMRKGSAAVAKSARNAASY